MNLEWRGLWRSFSLNGKKIAQTRLRFHQKQCLPGNSKSEIRIEWEEKREIIVEALVAGSQDPTHWEEQQKNNVENQLEVTLFQLWNGLQRNPKVSDSHKFHR